MRKIKRNYLIGLFTALFMCMSISGFSQPGDGLGDDPDNEAVPIDGGVGALLAAGAAYGLKKYREHKKKQNEDTGK